MKNTVTEALISTLRRKVKSRQSKKEIEFLRAYYHRLSGQDFNQEQALSFRSKALRHRRAGSTRNPGETIIEITSDEQDNSTIYIVTDDRPFIINSLLMKLNALGRTPNMTIHPLFVVTRDKNNKATDYERFTSNDQTIDKNRHAESYIQFETEFIPKSEQPLIASELRTILGEIENVVNDWEKMRDGLREHAVIASKIKSGPIFAEYDKLMTWLADDHFALLGYCEVDVTQSGSREKTKLDKGSVLGLLRSAFKLGEKAVLNTLPPIVFTSNAPIVFTKTRSRSTVHRPGYMDCIMYNHGFSDGKNRSRVSCFLGFHSGSSVSQPTSEIPHISKKALYVLETSKLREGGYAYKELRNILETLPREKLFQMEIKNLYSLCMSLLNQERRKTRVYLHKNVCGHYYSCLVYVPRDVFNSQLREKIQRHLVSELRANDIEFDVYFSASILTRIHYTIQADPDPGFIVDSGKLEQSIQEISRNWNDKLFEAIRSTSGREKANAVLARFRDSFSSAYERDYQIHNAVADIEIFSHLEANQIHCVLSSSTRQNSDNASFKIYCRENSIALSDALPILENMGVRILGGRPQKLVTTDGEIFRIREFEIARQDGMKFDYEDNARQFESTFAHCWNGIVENDGFNKLTLLAGLSWRRISLLRTYFRYLKQIRLRYSENYIIDALVNNPKLVVAISNLFSAKFDPRKNQEGTRKFNSEVKKRLEEVSTLDEDRIIRALLDVMSATLRTNYFQPKDDGTPKSYISIKLKSKMIPRIPEPAPEFEIFVYSPRVEGVHLRGGPVARGGLRWSERPEDFRTEVLGLVKAQRVKNAVIVPVGSKGGFVAKQLHSVSPEDVQKEVVACYRIFISSLLDITDNLSGNKVIPPKNVIRFDSDDPYLVVAADKGTATFSDIANSISEDYGFWLGDAFASGGSAGYDHKKMGITARGAWESVKRHFRELGKDIQTEPFTVVGIGDMGGDVFGNGMLLSKQIKLIAAFNHMHILIDPDPDPATSYKERKRLFDLPRSSWTDYDTKLISRGGGIFSRNAKSISLSAQAKKALGAKKDAYAPSDLINLILKSQVELLWNGGIGTYVKASTESHSDAQDRNNDSLRVDGNELRCKVIGEGGNLGMTQLARIEYSQLGGLCYTDAIDNSAGVDTSDHEVNIKILLNSQMQNGKLTEKARNKVLAKMEKDVGQLVLANNYLQTQILSIDTNSSNEVMPQQARAIQILEDKGLLNRGLEFLPDNNTLKERFESNKFLTRPELAVLLSYSKMDLYQELLKTELPANSCLKVEIEEYFPDLLTKNYLHQVHNHRLSKEIIATQVTNDLVGNMGATFHLKTRELTGASVESITAAYLASREILGSTNLVKQVQVLDNKVDAGIQMQCLKSITQCLESSIFWLLRNASQPVDIPSAVSQFASGYSELLKAVEKHSSSTTNSGQGLNFGNLSQNGIPEKLARTLVSSQLLRCGLDIVEIARSTRRQVDLAADVYFQLEKILGLDWLQSKIGSLASKNTWHERSKFSLSNSLRDQKAMITRNIISNKSKRTAHHCLEAWLESSEAAVTNLTGMIRTLKDESKPDFAMLSVVVSELSRLK